LNDVNFKKDVIIAGLGWGHMAEHTIVNELKAKKLTIMNFESIKPKELPIYLIRLRKQPMGIVSQALWSEMKSLSETK
jgi:DNA-binding transcriptional LysR family regulator